MRGHLVLEALYPCPGALHSSNGWIVQSDYQFRSRIVLGVSGWVWAFKNIEQSRKASIICSRRPCGALCVARPEQKAKGTLKTHLQKAISIFSSKIPPSGSTFNPEKQFQSFHRKPHLQGALSIQKSRRGPDRGTTTKFEEDPLLSNFQKVSIINGVRIPNPLAPCLSLAPTSKPTLYPAPA